MKRVWALVMAVLCLGMATACAEEAVLPDMDGLTALCDALVDTMYAQERTAFVSAEAETAPGVAYGLIWRLMYRGLLPCEPEADGTVARTEMELQATYEQLFASGRFVLPAEDCCDAIKRTAEGLRFDVSTASTGCAGMQIMLVEAGTLADTQSLLCELYHVEDDYYAITEDSLTEAEWYGTAVIEVRRDENAPLGWRIVSFGLAEDGDAGQSVG